MRKLLAGSLIILFVSSLTAQPDQQKGFFGISAGTALPVGSFSSTSASDNQAGFANAGFSGLVSANIHVKDYIGFAGMMGYQSNPYDEESFAEGYRSAYPGNDYQFSSGNYTMINILGGAFVSIPQGVLDINLKGFVGVSVCTLPASNSSSFSGMQGDPRLTLETAKNRSTAFSYGGGINLLFFVKNGLALILDAIYIQAEPEFNAVEVRVYENGTLTTLQGVDLTQKVQMISLSAGIAFLF